MRSALLRATLLLAYGAATSRRPAGDTVYVLRNAVVGGLLLADARRRGHSWEALGLDRTRLRSGWRLGSRAALTACGATVLAAVAGARVSDGRALLSDRRARLQAGALAHQVLVRIPLGTAAFEELAFRGVLLAALREAGEQGTAVIASSAAFGLWHIGPTLGALRENDVEAEQVIPVASAVAATTLAGLGLALLRLRGQHLLAPWLTHWGANAAGLLSAAVWQRSASA